MIRPGARVPVPPWGLAVTAMLSVQLGSALSVDLIGQVGAAGTAWLRLSMGAVIFLVIARPPLSRVRRSDVPLLLGLGVTTGLVTIGFLGTVVAVGIEPGRSVGWATLAPLLLAGIGSGFSISPNQAITLSEVPVSGGGSAAGVLQTGQRVGSSLGIAAVGAVFFSAVASTDGDYAAAFRKALLVTTVFVVAALVLALVDVLGGRTRRSGASGSQHRPEHRWSAAH